MFRPSRLACLLFNVVSFFFTHLSAANAQQATVCTSEENKDAQILCLHAHGLEMENERKLDSALYFYEQALTVSQQIRSTKRIGESYWKIGRVHYRLDNFNDALLFFKDAAVLLEKSGDRFGAANCLHNVGSVYNTQGKYVIALDYFFKALKIFNVLGISRPGTLNNIAITYQWQGDYTLAIVYYEKALKAFTEMNDPVNVANILNNLSGAYYLKEEYEKGEAYATKALQIYEAKKDTMGMAGCWSNLASIFVRQSRKEKSLEYFNRIIRAFPNDSLKKVKVTALSGLSSLSLEQGDFDKSIELGTQAFRYADQMKLLREKNDISQTLYQAYLKVKDYKNALVFLEIHKSSSDSLFSFENKLKIARLETKVELDQKENEVRLAHAALKVSKSNLVAMQRAQEADRLLDLIKYEQNKRISDSLIAEAALRRIEGDALRTNREKLLNEKDMQLKISYTITAGLVLVALALFFSIRSRNKERKATLALHHLNENLENIVAARTEQIELQKHKLVAYAESEMLLLKNQLSPHFFFNALQNVYVLINTQPKEASGLLLSLSEIMRYYMGNSPSKLIIIKKEIDAINNYIQIEKIRLKPTDKLDIRIETDPEADMQIPPMIFLTLIENCFKHGVGVKNCEISIGFTVRKSGLSFQSVNAVQPVKGKVVGHGIGLSNVKKQLDLVFPSRHSFQSYEVDHFYYNKLEIF